MNESNELTLYEATVDVVDCRVLLICLVMKFDFKNEVINPYSFKIDHLEVREQEYIGQEPNGYNIVENDPIIEKIHQMILDGFYDYELKYKALELYSIKHEI